MLPALPLLFLRATCFLLLLPFARGLLHAAALPPSALCGSVFRFSACCARVSFSDYRATAMAFLCLPAPACVPARFCAVLITTTALPNARRTCGLLALTALLLFPPRTAARRHCLLFCCCTTLRLPYRCALPATILYSSHLPATYCYKWEDMILLHTTVSVATIGSLFLSPFLFYYRS